MPHKMMNSQIADVLHDNRLSIEARILSLSVFSNQQVTSLVVNLKPRLKTGAPI